MALQHVHAWAACLRMEPPHSFCPAKSLYAPWQLAFVEADGFVVPAVELSLCPQVRRSQSSPFTWMELSLCSYLLGAFHCLSFTVGDRSFRQLWPSSWSLGFSISALFLSLSSTVWFCSRKIPDTLTSVVWVRGSERPVVFCFVVHKASHLLVRPVLGPSR